MTTTPPPGPGPVAPLPWYRRPGPCLAAGAGLIVASVLLALAWALGDVPLARPLGYVAGAAGIYLVYGGVLGLRERRA